MLITKARVDNEDSLLGDTEVVTALPGSAAVLFEFKALHFSHPERIRYKYRLIGHQDEWTEAHQRRSVYYHHIPPGRYEFQVIADNGFDAWNEKGASLAVVVLPQWWQRSSVRVGAIGLLVLIGFLGYRQRTARLKRRSLRQEQFSRQLLDAQEAERKRIAADLHDSLGQNLLIAKNQLYLVQEAEEDPKLQDRLAHAADSVGEALEEARSISHRLRPLQLERLGLTKALNALARQVTASTNMKIDTELADLDELLPVESELILYRMVQEALSNVIKHADASQIWLSGEVEGKQLTVEVQDDGRGFDVPENLDGGSGLGLTGFRERARLLHANFTLESTPGEGTRWKVKVPMKSPQTP